MPVAEHLKPVVAQILNHVPWAYPIPVYGFDHAGCQCGDPKCRNLGKHPYRGATQHKLTRPEVSTLWTTADQVARIGGIGLNPRPGYFVLDVDLKLSKGISGHATLDRLNREHPEAPVEPHRTLAAKTPSGGLHLWFRLPEGVSLKSSTGVLGADSGLDIRTHLGFVVAPPSPHRFGSSYEWITPIQDIQTVPGWFLDLIKTPKRFRPEPERKPVAIPEIRKAFEALIRDKKIPELEKVIRGEVFAFEGAREATIWRLSRILARAPQMKHYRSEDIAQVFAPSLSQMGSDAPSPHDVADKINRQRDNIREESVGEIQESAKIVTGIDRGPYTTEELAAHAPHPKQWVIKVGAKYYVWCLDHKGRPDYSRYDSSPHTLNTNIARHLDVGCFDERLIGRDEQNNPFPVGTLFGMYGTELQSIRLTYESEGASVDLTSKTLRLSSLPHINIEPEYDPDVDRWLQSISTDQKFWVWLATYTQLDRPTAALWLLGPKGTGKSLLAVGLSQVWGMSYVPFREAIGRFNARIKNQPVILADEGLNTPSDVNRKDLPNRFKSLVTNGFHKIEEKNVGAQGLEGYVRLILTSNDTDPIKSISRLDGDNAKAIAERILLIRMQPEAAQVLTEINPQERGWTKHGTIAKHLLWLRDFAQDRNIDRLTGDRFLVPGNLTVADLARLHEDASDFFRALFDLIERALNPQPRQTSMLMVPLAHAKLESWLTWQNGKLYLDVDRLIRDGVGHLLNGKSGFRVWERIHRTIVKGESREIDGKKWVCLNQEVVLTFASERPMIRAFLERKI